MLGQPSVIARLMGLEDTIVPAPATPAVMIQAEEDTVVNLLKPSSGEVRQPKCSPLSRSRHGRINGDYYRYCLSKMKPWRRSRRSSSSRRDHDRQHPQEELLEKIKEEFRASWQQASMAPSPAEVEVEENTASTVASASGRRSGADRAGWVDVDGRYIQRVAQENLRREKMARHGHGARGKTKVEDEDEDVEMAVVVPLNKAEEAEQLQGGSEVTAAKDAESEDRFMEEGTSDSHRAESQELLGAVVNGDREHDQMSSTSENSRGIPTRIAILRPIGTVRAAAGDHREPAFGTPPPSWKATRDGGMEEFLRAVKERLDNEMKAKAGNGDLAPPTTTTGRRGWGIAGTKGDTARQIREAMETKEDLGRRLSRLESFRVFRGDRGRRDAAAVKSPEHRMLKSVRARIEAMSPKKTRLGGSSSPVSSRGGRAWSSPPAEAGHASSLSGIGSDDDDDKEESRCRGDRQRLMTKLWKAHAAAPTADTDIPVSPTPSPRALVRSFSAPAPSRVPDGGSETCGEGAEVKFSRSRSFSLLRGTVSSCFSLLLMHLTKKSPPSPQDSGDLTTAAQADFLAGLAPPSPVSPLEVHGRSPRHFSGGFSCTFLPESSPKWSPKRSSELGASVGGGAESPWRWRTDTAAESTDDPDRVYVRELLIAAGLFDDDDDAGSSEDTAAAAIMPGGVFDEVEDAYYFRHLCRCVDEDGGAGEEEEDGSPDRRRLLFDLANEALQAVARGAVSSSSPSLRQWVIEGGNNGVSSSYRLPLRGRDLEDDVWRHVAQAMTGDDAPARTVDGMVEREVGRSPWMALREDACAVGRKVERAIFDELVGEVVRQLFVRT